MEEKTHLQKHGWVYVYVILFILVFATIWVISIPERYNTYKHDCIDWRCGYFNPFGEDSFQFKISQVINWTGKEWENWTDRTRCPPMSGEYCYKDDCIPNPLTMEECVEWVDKDRIP